jgi:hypothetical protein
MTTLGEMKSAIAREFVNEQYSDEEAGAAIAKAIKHYAKREWWFTRATLTITTVAGQRYYESDDISRVLKIYGMQTEGCDVLSSAMPFFGADTGKPTRYTMVAKRLAFDPIPDRAYSVDVFAWQKLPDVTDDDDGNAWFDDAEELIRQSAKRRIATDNLLADDMAARCEGLEFEAYSALQAENRLRLPEQLLRVDGLPVMSQWYDIRTG